MAVPQPGQRVRVHYHLRRKDFSVTDPRLSLVIANVADITLADAVFRVQPGGLARIREQGQRAVCAYAVGTVTAVSSGPDLPGWGRVTFNPFRADTFTLDGEPVTRTPLVVFAGAYAWVPPGADGLW